MPSDKYYSRTAKARDLIFSLINVASSRDVPFHPPQLLQCLHQGATFVPLWSPILHNRVRWRFVVDTKWLQSAWDIKIDEALLVLCFAYYVFAIAEIETLWLSRIEMWGAFFHYYILRIFRNGWMHYRDAFHAAVCLYCSVTDKA